MDGLVQALMGGNKLTTVPENNSMGQAMRQQQLAQLLLKGSQNTNNPLIAGLAGYLGASQLGSATETLGNLQEQERKNKLKRELEQQEFERQAKTRDLDLREMQIRATQSNAAATRALTQANKERDRIDKRLEKISKSNIPGFDFKNPNILPTEKNAEEFTNTVSTTTKMNRIIDDILIQMEDVGTESFDVFGTEAADLKRAYTDLLLLSKEVDKLGALSGPDLQLEIDKLPDPTSFFTPGFRVKKQFKKLKEQLGRELKAEADLRGYKAGDAIVNQFNADPIKKSKQKPAGAAPDPSGFTIRKVKG